MDLLMDEDIEMMETDDVSDNVFVNKRKFNSIDETIGVSNVSEMSPKVSPNPELRPHLKARRVLPKMCSESEPKNNFCLTIDEKVKPICVLDTNILLSNLIELKSVIISEEKLRQTTSKSKLKSFIIPWIVVQELDGLKTNKDSKSVVNVIHFINEQLKKSNGVVKGENSFQKDFKSNKNFKQIEEEVNDDKIINCCLKLKTVLDSNNIILVTNDLNLCNKALMTQLNAINWNEFLQKYKSSDLFIDETKVEEEEESVEPKNKRLAKTRLKTDDNSVSKLRFSLNEKMNRKSGQMLSTSSCRTPKPTSPLKYSLSTPRKKSPIKRKSGTSLSGPVSQKLDFSDKLDKNSDSNEIPLKYNDWIQFRDECEQKLLKFIENIYREIWENDWKKMLELDVNNTNFKEIIRVLRKEWNSNFSDIFNRDKSIKALIDSIHSNSRSNANYHLIYKDLKHFVDLVEQKQSNRNNTSSKSRKTI